MALQTNRTPFSDVLTLIKTTDKRDEDGYLVGTVPAESREVFCSFTVGASRAEFYEAAKAGMRITATVEIWEDDYGGEKRVSISDADYKVERVWPSGAGTLFLYLSEVIR